MVLSTDGDTCVENGMNSDIAVSGEIISDGQPDDRYLA